MERLSERNKNGTAFFPLCFDETCNGEGSTSKCDSCAYQISICERLTMYEDTELTPEEIKHLKEKQISKPITPMNFGEYYICPNCKVTIFYGRRKPLKYCEDCGQAITGPGEHLGKLKTSI